MRPFIPCRKCVGKPGPKPGYYYDMLDGFQVIVECDCHKNWKSQVEFERNLKISNINPDYEFKDYVGSKSIKDCKALEFMADHYEKFNYKTMVYLWGKNGCQKTSMVQTLGKQLISKGYTVQYTLMSDLLNALVKEFEDENSSKKEAFIKRCMNVDLLIVDESFDSRKVTIYKSGYQIPYLDNFIRNRFEIEKKSIIFVSNKKPNEIEEQGFGLSVQNLVERNTTQSFLKFEDEYIKSRGVPDRMGIFR